MAFDLGEYQARSRRSLADHYSSGEVPVIDAASAAAASSAAVQVEGQ